MTAHVDTVHFKYTCIICIILILAVLDACMRGFSHFEMWLFSNKGSTSEGGVEEKAERTKKGPGPCCSLRIDKPCISWHIRASPKSSTVFGLVMTKLPPEGKKHKYVGNLQGHMTQGESDAYIVRKASYVL